MAALVALLALAQSAAAEENRDAQQQALTFMRAYLKQHSSAADLKSAQYVMAFADLNNDGKDEAIIYVSGEGWCGSGGCSTYVLAPQNTSYRLVTKTSIDWLPVRLLNASHHGWRDIGVFVAGGGIHPGYEAALSFDGRRYPSNPTIPPARRVTRAAGHVLLSEKDQARPLVPDSLN